MKTSDQPIRVLLADDHAVVRAGIRQFLEQAEDFEVEHAEGDPMPSGPRCPVCGGADMWDERADIYICPSPAKGKDMCPRSEEYARKKKAKNDDK